MKNGRIGPVNASAAFSRAPESGYFPLRKAALEARKEQRRDIVELTEPHRAALRLLRERVLAHTRRCLALPVGSHHKKIQFARIPGDDPKLYLQRLLSDQNLLASQRRGKWLDDAVDSAIENGLLEGMGETLEILNELGHLSADTWRIVCGLLDKFYGKCFGICPETMRQELWKEI